MPQGSLQGTKTKSNIRLVVFLVVAVHAVFFVGLLMQGCQRETPKPTVTEPSLPALDTNDLKFYTRYEDLPKPTPVEPVPSPYTPTMPVTPVPSPAMPVEPYVPVPVEPAAPAATKDYTIGKGDTFYSIGQKHGVSMQAIAKANPGVDPTRLKVGQKIVIPEASAASAASAKPAASTTASGGKVYVVKSGDTLTKIAQQNGTTVEALRKANNLRTDRILVGQKLTLP